MNRSWQLFWVIELGLFCVLGYQILTNPAVLIALVVGLVAVLLGCKLRFGRAFWLTFGVVLIILAVFINPAVWVMLFIAAIAVLRFFSETSGFGPWSKKAFVTVATKDPEARAGTRLRRPWFGNERIGSEPFTWDNINMTVAAGDTIIDLGNTILPKGDSTIVVRKGVGKTRILVPVGVGVMVSHSGGFGTLTMDGQEVPVHTETVEQFSNDYDSAARRIHILTNVVIGDVEVLAV